MIAERTYHAPHGGLPDQTTLLTGRAVFTEAYAVIPKGVMRDIVVSRLPFWERQTVATVFRSQLLLNGRLVDGTIKYIQPRE